jgi:urease accessory protein
MKSNTIGLLLVFVLMLCAGAAEAHHVMDGEMPATWGQGLLSGLGHPIIGIDHLAAVFGVGALAAAQGASARVMIAFVVAMLAGAAVHAGKADIPAGEILVGVSLLAFAALLFVRSSLSSGWIALLFAAAGLIHGYVLGESIVGAEQAPLVAYFIGLAVIQSAVAILSFLVMRQLLKLAFPLGAAKTAACIIGLVGIFALASQGLLLVQA